VHVSDAPWHNDPEGDNPYDCTATNYDSAVTAMNAIGAKHIGVFVSSWDDEGLHAMESMSEDTGAVDIYGNPLVVHAETGSVSTAIVDMIRALAATGLADVSSRADDEPDDPPGANFDATRFVRSSRPDSASPPAPEGFAYLDETTFHGVEPGTVVRFDVSFSNTVVAPTSVAQFFRVWITVIADGVARLDRRLFIVIVPPVACEGG
jgi:hypothetical protein